MPQPTKPIEQQEYVFYYSDEIVGWSTPVIVEQTANKDLSVLFRTPDRSQYFDLKEPVSTEILLDNWFQRLLKLSSSELENHL